MMVSLSFNDLHTAMIIPALESLLLCFRLADSTVIVSILSPLYMRLFTRSFTFSFSRSSKFLMTILRLNSSFSVDLIASTTTELVEIEQVLEQTSVSIKQPDNREMFDCQGQTHDGTSYLSDKTFSHSKDTLSHGTIPLCQDRPGPKPPDLACCYPKKSHGTIPLCQDRPGPKPPDLACCYPKKFRYKD